MINNDTFITCVIKPYVDELKLYSDGFKIDIMNLKIELNKLDSTNSIIYKIERDGILQAINDTKIIIENFNNIIYDDVSTDNTQALDTLSFCNTKGYTPLDILTFCIKFKIRCFGYNFKMERFITNKDNNIVFNPNLPAFVYYFNDEHIYLINDKQMRHSLLNNNSTKSDIISLLSNERKIEDSKTPKI